MEIVTKMCLLFLEAVAVIGAILSLIVSIMVFFFMVGLILVPGAQGGFLQQIGAPKSFQVSTGMLLFELLVGLIGALCLMVICRALHHIISNIGRQTYFVPENLAELRQILVAISTLVMTEVVSGVVFQAAHLASNQILVNYPTSLFSDFMVFATIFVVYVVFKRGLALQVDSDQMI